MRCQPLGYLFTFQLPIQVPVTAARTDHHRCTRISLGGWAIDGERRLRNVGDHPRRCGDFDLVGRQRRRAPHILGSDRPRFVRRSLAKAGLLEVDGPRRGIRHVHATEPSSDDHHDLDVER